MGEGGDKQFTDQEIHITYKQRKDTKFPRNKGGACKYASHHLIKTILKTENIQW